MIRALIRLLGLVALAGGVAYGQACVTNSQVTLTGNLRGANGIPTSNATLTLRPSQAGFIASCGVNLPVSTFCGTSTDGSVIQTANPFNPPLLTTSGSGSLPAATYYVVYEWYDSLGHVTLISPESRLTLSVTESLVVNPPSSGVPATASGMDVFIGTTSGGETLQGQSSGASAYVQSTPLISGASPSATNTTVCVVTANDSVWPTGTGYAATMTDSSGNPLPGFPMLWQLMGPGTTINLSNGLPYYHGVVTYPVPILSAPQNHGQQSISGPLSLGGYNLFSVGRGGFGTSTPGWGVDVEGAGINGVVNAAIGYLINGNAGSSGQGLCSDGTYLDLLCTFITGPVYYQTILNGSTIGTAVTQRTVLGFNQSGLVATDVLGVGSNVTRTNVEVNATTGLTGLITDPYVVNAAGPGTSTHCMQWDSIGGAGDSGAPCSGGGTPRTCNTHGCYAIATDGTVTEWVPTGALNNNTPTTITLPATITTSIMSITCTDNSSRVQSGNNQPIGANVAGLSAPYTTFFADTPSTGVTAYCTVTGY